MKRILTVGIITVGLLAGSALADGDLAKNFAAPPNESKSWCYWWWLNGAASSEGITHDFEEMRKQGIGGALLLSIPICAHQDGQMKHVNK